MAKIRTLLVLIIVVACPFWNHGIFGQEFRFEAVNQADQLVAKKDKLNLKGTVALNKGLSACVKKQVDIQVVSSVCSVDLESCSAGTNNKTGFEQPCSCVKKTGNDYSLRVQTMARTAHSALKLQAMMTSKNKLNSAIVGAANIGQMPKSEESAEDSDSLIATVKINENGEIRVTKTTVLNLCDKQFNEIIFCIKNKTPKARLSINLDGMKKTTQKKCVKMMDNFDLASRSYTVKFTHEDESGSDEFILPVKAKQEGCSSVSSSENADALRSTVTGLSVPVRTSTFPMTSVCANVDPVDGDGSLVVVKGADGKMVMCETKVAGGKWTVIQRRMDDKVNFYRDWKDYVEGFGTYPDEIWFGLENLHQLCKRMCQLRFDLGGAEGYVGNYWAAYSYFKVLGAKDGYQVKIGGYSGNAGNDFNVNDYKFATRDKDFKPSTYGGCGQIGRSGWWYGGNCRYSNINGLMAVDDTYTWYDAAMWNQITKNWKTPITYSEMKVRPIVPLKDVCIEEMDKKSAGRVLVTSPDGVKFACETKRNGGGWTIVQRRASSDVDFYRNMADYRGGFGDVSPNGTFWWGLDKITELCSSRCELRFDMVYEGRNLFAHYDFFKLAKVSTTSRLVLVDGHSGTAADGMPQIDFLYSWTYRSNSRYYSYFSSNDVDMSRNSKNHPNKCVLKLQGGWWFKLDDSCGPMNPNGNFGEQNGLGAMSWSSITGSLKSLDFIEVKVRPLSESGRFKPLRSECDSADLKASGDIGVVQSLRKNIPLVCLSHDNKKWTLIQQRVKGDVNFNRSYVEYINGFGDIKVNGDFWIGLDNIVDMCNVYSQCNLLINFGFENKNYSVAYRNFYLYGKRRFYRIQLAWGAYLNPNRLHGDHLKWHAKNMHKMYFSTYDFGGSDSNAPQRMKCAREGGGGWWYIPGWSKSINGCREIGPNGVFNSTGKTAVVFKTKTGTLRSVSFMKMWVTKMY